MMSPQGIRRDRVGSRGYTVVELIAVCAIILVILALGWPNFASAARSVRLNNVAYQIAADIRATQELAQARWTRSRFVLTSDGYEVQVGNVSDPSADCSVPLGYELVKRVSLSESGAQIANVTLSCFVFERTGRAVLESPAVVDYSPVLDSTSLTRLFNRMRFGTGTLWNYSSEAARWENQQWIRFVVDLGEERDLKWIRPCMAAKANERVPLPGQISLAWSPALLGKDDTGWTTLETRYGPGPCEEFSLLAAGGPVRYLRFEFEANKMAPRSYRLAIDEIELEAPGFEVQDETGSLTRTLAVNPVSGVVVVK